VIVVEVTVEVVMILWAAAAVAWWRWGGGVRGGFKAWQPYLSQTWQD